MKIDDIVVIDVETTGLCCIDRELWQLALVPLDTNKPTFNGMLELTTDTSKFDPIALDMYMQNVKPAETVAANYIKIGLIRYVNSVFCKKPILAGQNVGFDIRFLEKFLYPWRLDSLFDYHSLDLWSIVQERYNYGKNVRPPNSLREICEAYNVINERPHDALSDASATASVLRKIISISRGCNEG